MNHLAKRRRKRARQLSHHTQPDINGFTLTELIIAVGIVVTLSFIAIPSYFSQACKSKTTEVISSVSSLQAIISAYIDETGAYPTNWDNLNSISAIMSVGGEMTGEFTEIWTLPSEHYEITVSGPASSTYNITGVSKDGCPNRDVKACLNASTGASKLSRGDGTTNAVDVICT
ncbi:pilin polypeptide PilA-like N-terminal methylation domain-containing protein [Synechococcus sp. BIOS-E4-1]|uniref:type IV pilin protein n=1 Tax=Synechococcus sp. BIOS-E4-1 TaxID=1400864 RepID=UPI001647CA98|nr:prepilin-type N-terminal cleavage/methylation domain-containing protein [Synechococcus sp. BIOS-E4-1]QNI53312.1 pilin polypeptide PilA-like N-terminal methylation domain-containing protein [Synechococcus sp. BIOS-E4-1]